MITPTTAPIALPPPRARILVRRLAGFVSRNRTVLLFALFLVLADLGIGALAPVWDRHSPDDYTARIRGCAERPRDVVFVGGSPVTEGIDPAPVAGAVWRGRPLDSAYAIGLHGGTATDFYYAVRLACPTPPRLIVYGATASDLNDSRNEPHGTRALLTARDVAEVARTRPDAASWVIRHSVDARAAKASNLYRYRHGIRMWAALRAEAAFPGSCPEAARQAADQRDHADDLARCGTGYAPLSGYAPVRYDRVKAAGHAPPPFNYLDKFRTGSHLKYVHKLADWCRDNGTELLVLDMPVTSDLEARHAREFAEYHTRIADLARERGLTVVAGSRAGLTDEHFADLIHMNPTGCRTFSAWLRDALEAAGRTP